MREERRRRRKKKVGGGKGDYESCQRIKMNSEAEENKKVNFIVVIE